METKKISKRLLKIICCPVDKANLVYNKSAQTLACRKCKHQYPVIGGIPVLLPPEQAKAGHRK